MKIGVEEEFIVVSISNFFHTPAAPKMLSNLIYRDIINFRKFSVETPLGRKKFPKTISDIVSGFSIIEAKTSPHNDIDLLKEEISFNRNLLIDAAIDQNLALLPIGVHPFFSEDLCGTENCAALHVHLSGCKKEQYLNILRYIPELIALTANSPFLNGEHKAMCSRALMSPSIGVPKNYYYRDSDLIFNKHLDTTELRVCDSQVYLDDVIGLAATLMCVADLRSNKKISKEEYLINRKNAIIYGKKSLKLELIQMDIRERINELSLFDVVDKFFKRKTGAEWQLDCKTEYGFSTLLRSLWESMKRGQYLIVESNQETSAIIEGKQNAISAIHCLPFLIYNVIKKIKQDDAVNTTNFFGRSNNEEGSDIYSY